MKRTGIAMLVCALALAGPAGAGDYNDDADGNWNASGTWVPAGVPASGDTATVDSHTVALDINLTGAAAPDLITMAGGTLDVPWEQNRTIESPIDAARVTLDVKWS